MNLQSSNMGYTIFLVLVLATGSFAGPINEITVSERCARQCTVSNQFNYETGKTYEFTYDTDIRTAIQGASEEHAGVHLSSKVYLDFISQCEMVMRLSDVKLSEHDPVSSTMKPVTSELIRDLENNPLTVSYQDGSIEDICMSRPETDKTLNIKRGILSLIQNKMDDINAEQTVKESDVAGNCDTTYTSEDSGWYNKIIKKSKNLLGCTGRRGGNTAIQGIPYQSNSAIQGLPLVKSTQECEQKLTKATGRLVSATCHESHVFTVFSRQQSGATTHNTQNLVFIKEYSSNARPSTLSIRTPIVFQHMDGNSEEANVKNLERKLIDICEATTEGVTPDTPKLFSSLVYAVKPLDATSLESVYKKIKSQSICSKNNARVSTFFQDAIPMAATTEAVKFMTKLITSGEIVGLKAEMWMRTLAFIQQPTVDMLTDVKALLNVDSVQETAMLSVSSLINSICRNNPSCDNYIEVKKIISLLENKIAPACKTTDETFRQSLLALRAIGNAGFGAGAIPTLMKCTKAGNPIEIRLAAIEAYRRMPCSVDKSSVFAVFSDVEEDSEVRFTAYKTLMECASDDLIRKVKIVLSKEQVNQVGSYVWTHLTNLMETSDPHKQSIRSILEDETLKAEFNMDSRKFSRNYEKSLFIEKLNTGASIEGDLVWSSKSFIPRSGMLNLTVDLFGNAINLFEIGGRMEGLEYFFESYFGPNGYFSDNDVQAAVDEMAVDTIKADKVKRIDRRMGTAMDELRGSLFIRIFGNEINYQNFRGIDSLISQNSVNFFDVLMKLAKDNHYQFTHNVMFADSCIIIPTSSGFPLNLTINGTATFDLQASGKVDVLKLASSPSALDINGIIRPSAAIVITGSMGVDALSTEVGVKMVNTMHTKTAMQGKVTLADGSILNAEFNMPDEKMEIFSVKSEFYTVHRNGERKQNMITDNRQTYSACSGNTISRITGLELCASLAFPNASLVENAPYFPMTGPVSGGITLYKRDSKMTGYKLEARSTHDNELNVIRFDFSTPNSIVDRSFGFDLSLDKAKGSFGASVTSPWKRGYVNGAIVNDRNEKGLSGRMNWDNKVLFELDANLKAERTNAGTVWTPSVVITAPNGKSTNLKGSVTYIPKKQLETELVLKGVSRNPISLKVDLISKQKQGVVSASLKLGPQQEYSFDSSVQKTDYKKKVIYKPRLTIRTPSRELVAFGGTYTNVYGKNVQVDFVLDKITKQPVILKANIITKEFGRKSRRQNIVRLNLRSSPVDLQLKSKLDNRNWKTIATDIDFTYVIKGIARDNLKLVSKVRDMSNKKSTITRANINVASKQHPDYNFKMLSDFNHNLRSSELDIGINYGKDFKNKNNAITLSTSLKRSIKSWTFASATFNGKLEIGTDTRVVTKIDHSHSKRSLDSTVMLRLNKDALQATLKLDDTSKALKSLAGQFDLSLPRGRSISISQTINETQPDDYTLSSSARWGKTRNNLLISWSRPTAKSLKFASDISLDSMEPITVNAEYSLEDRKYKIAASVSKNKQKYSTDISAAFEDSTILSTVDISIPTRHIITNYESKTTGNRYSTRADLRWNADRDDNERVIINCNGLIESLSNIDGDLTIQYPSRTIALKLKQSMTSKFVSNIEFKWDAKSSLSIDTTFGDYNKPGKREIVATLYLRSPFEPINSIDVSIDHTISSNDHTTKLDFGWSRKDKISGTMTVKSPMSLRNVDVEITAKAPAQGLKAMQVSLKHKISNGVSSTAIIGWNKQNALFQLTLSDDSNQSETNLKGQINIKTSYRKLKSASVTLEHTNNGRKIENNALVQVNKQTYGLKSTVSGSMVGWNIISNGDIEFTLPSNSIGINWQHRSNTGEITSTLSFILDGKSTTLKVNGLQDMNLSTGTLSGTVQLMSPYKNLKDVALMVTHQHDKRKLNSAFTLKKDNAYIARSELKYQMTDKGVNTAFSMTNPYFDGDVTATADLNYDDYPFSGKLEIALTPLKKFTAEGSFNKRADDIDMSVKVSVPETPSVTVSGSRILSQSGIATELTIEYKPNQIIRLKGFHRNDYMKQIRLMFTSPFTTDYVAEMKYNSKNSNSVYASIEAEPFLRKWSLTGSYDNMNGNARITTPYQKYPYGQINFINVLQGEEKQSTINVEYMPGKIVKLNLLYNIKSAKDMKITVELSTPYEAIPRASAKLSNIGDLSEFRTSMEIEYYPDKKLSADTTFSKRDKLAGSVILKSPFMNDISASFEQKGVMTDFQTHAELSLIKSLVLDLTHQGTSKAFTSTGKLTIDSNSYGGSLLFSLRPKLETTLMLEAPSKSLRLSHVFDGTDLQFFDHFEGSMTGYGMYVSDINVDITKIVDVSFAIQTPIKGMRDMKLSYKHEKSQSGFKTHGDAHLGLEMYSVDVIATSEPSRMLQLTMKTPITGLKTLRGILSLDGENGIYKVRGEFQKNKDTSEFILNANYAKKIDVDLTIRSPYTNTIKASIDHWGKLQKFQSKLVASYGSQKVAGNIRLATKPTFSAIINMKSPMQWLKNHQISLKHAGTMDDFKANMQYKLNGKPYIGEVSFQNLESMKGDFSLKGPSFKPIKASLSHEGSLKNFKSSASISSGRQSAEANANVNVINGIKGGITVQTPFTGYETMNAAVSHSGNIKNFKTHAEVGIKKRTVEMDISIDTKSDMSGSVSILTPFNGYKDVQVSFKHSGNLNDFRTTGKFSKDGESVEAQTEYNNNKVVSGSAYLRSTYAALNNYEASFIHEGDLSKFTTKADVKYGQDHSTAQASFDSTSGYEGSLSLETPTLKNTEVHFKHQPTSTAALTNAFVTYNDQQKYSFNSDISTDPVSGIITVTTPHEGYESTELSLHHDGNTDAFRSNVAFSIFGDKYESEISYSTSPDMQMTLTVKSPNFDDFMTTFSRRGTIKHFDSQFELVYGSTSMIRTDLALNLQGPYSGDFKIISPRMNNFKASFMHQESAFGFVSNGQIMYSGQKTTALISLTTNPVIEAKVEISSPLSKDIAISFSKNGPKMHSELFYESKPMFTLDTSLIILTDVTGEMKLTTAIPGYSSISAMVSTRQDASELSCHVELSLEKKNIILGELTFSPSSGQFKLETPIFHPITASFDVRGENLLKTDSKVQLSYGNSNICTVSADIDFPDSVLITIHLPLTTYEKSQVSYKNAGDLGGKLEIEFHKHIHTIELSADINQNNIVRFGIQSPFLSQGPVSITVDQRGTLYNFDVKTNVKFNSKEISSEIQLQLRPRLSGRVKVTSPYTEQLEVAFEVEGGLRNFKTSGELQYGTESHRSSLSLNMRNGVDGIFSLSSPKIVPVSAKLMHSGPINNLKTNGGLTIGNNKYAFDTVVTSGTSNEAFFSITLPSKSPIKGRMSANGIVSDFSANAELTLDDNTYTSEASLNLINGVRGNLRFNSPLEQMSATVDHSGSIRNFNSEIEVDINGAKSLGKAHFDVESTISGNAEISIVSLPSYKIGFEQTEDMLNYHAVGKIQKNNNVITSADLNLSITPFRANVNIITPFKGYETIDALVSYSGEKLSFSNHADINISGKKTEFDMDFDIATKSEGKVSLNSAYFPSMLMALDFAGNSEDYTSNVLVSFDKNEYSIEIKANLKTDIDMTFNLKTPIDGYKSLTGKLKNSGTFPEVNTFVSLKSGRRTLMTTDFILSCVSGIETKLSFQSVKTPTIQLAFAASGDTRRFNMNGDIRVDGTQNKITVIFQTSPSVSSSFGIESSFFKPVKGALTVTPEKSGQNVNIEGSYGEKKLTTNLRYASSGFSIAVSTPFDGYRKMQGSASLKRFYKSFAFEAEAANAEQKFNLDSSVNWRQGLKSSISIITPANIFGRANADLTLTGDFPNMEIDFKSAAFKQSFSLNGEIKGLSVAKLNVETPFEGFESIGLSLSSDGDLSNLNINGKIDYMTGKSIVVSASNMKTTDRLETKASLTTPYTEDITFDLALSGNPMDFNNDIGFSFGNGNSASLTTKSKVSLTSVAIESSLRSIVVGTENENRIKINYDGNFPNIETSLSAKVLGSYYSTKASFEYDDAINAVFNLKTPFADLRDVDFSFEHTGNLNRFSTKSELQYNGIKTMSGNVQFLRYGFRRIEASFEVFSPFTGFETTKASYRHTGTTDGFECDTDLSIMNKDISGTLRMSASPASLTVSVATPFEGFEQVGADMKLSNGNGIMNSQASLTYMQGKSISISADINALNSPKSASIKLTTPFIGFENTELNLVQSGPWYNSEASGSLTSNFIPSMRLQGNLRYNKWSNLDAGISFTSQIKNVENLKVSVSNEGFRGKYLSKAEVAWSPSKSIMVEGSFTDNRYSTGADITILTPFQSARKMVVSTRTDVRGNVYGQKITAQHNTKTVFDADLQVDISDKTIASFVLRSPVRFAIDMSGQVTNDYEGMFRLAPMDINTENGYSLSGQYSPSAMKLALKYTCPENTVQLDATPSQASVMFNDARYGYDLTLQGREKSVKLLLPERSLMASLSQGSDTTEGYFKWDADRDESKKIGFRSVVTPMTDALKADITLMMPSLAKELQIDSEMIVNRGRVIFDGKTELTYSRDSRKKFTITSKVQDISSWSSKNYSLTFGISHPYTSVDMQMSSHVGSSDKQVTGGLDIKYMTSKMETLTFAASGVVDKSKNSASLLIDTPMKKIDINAEVNTSPYRLSISNQYDNKRPLNTMVTFDPSKRSIDLQMNYDLDNPTSEFHINAKYVNSSAIATEIYHVINRQKISDAFVALRLNNSHLLHSRLHWRPELLSDMKAYAEKKSSAYSRRMKNFVEILHKNTNQELVGKQNLIASSFETELAPFVAIAEGKKEKLVLMYERNDYHIRDVTETVVNAAENSWSKIEDAAAVTSEYLDNTVTNLQTNLNVRLSHCMQRLQNLQALQNMKGALRSVAEHSYALYNEYSEHIHNTSKQYMDSSRSRYNSMTQYMSEMEIPSMADSYTSTIYGARDYINSGLNNLLARDDIKYAKSFSDKFLQHGKNAYKYWEIRENTETVMDMLMDMVKEEIDKEIANIKGILLKFQKSSVTIWDPEHGEIQADVYLPIPLRSLDTIPQVEVDISRYEKMVPDMTAFDLPDMDLSQWIPPFDASAVIKGNTVNTFDGVSYDLTSSCTFLLAKDSMDGNFTIILHKDGNNKTLNILADGRNIELFNDGQVFVDKKALKTPAILKNIVFTSDNGIVSIDIAGSVDVTLYPEMDTFIITIDGFYFGRTTGILGSYDNEPSNDIMTSFGKPVDNVDRFVKTWDVGTGRCR